MVMTQTEETLARWQTSFMAGRAQHRRDEEDYERKAGNHRLADYHHHKAGELEG